MLWGTTYLDRAVGFAVLRAIAVVWLALVAVYGLLDGVRELRQLSESYHLGNVLWYLLLTAPRRAYQVFPFAALVGAVVAIGGLAATSGLIAWRALGATRARLLVPMLAGVTLLLLAAVVMAEFWASDLELKARSYRLAGITGQVSLADPGGLWLRDGEYFIHIQYPFLNQSLETDFHQIRVYQLDEQSRLSTWLIATTGQHLNLSWQLNNVHQFKLTEAGAVRRYHAEMRWPSNFGEGTLGNSVLRPSLLAIRDLRPLLSYFAENSLDGAHYHAALWRRYFYPAIVWAAVLLGAPFVLRMQGRESRTRALAIAVAVGLAWYVAERLWQSVVLALRWSPFWGGVVPVLLALILVLILMRRR